MNKKLPDGWEVNKLGEICSFLSRGISPKYLEQGGACVLNQKCIRDHNVSYDQARRHDLKIKTVSPERFIQLGDVLVNSTGTGTLGRVAQVRNIPFEPTTVDSHVTIVRPKPGKFFLDFFGYMLVFIEELIKQAGEGCGGQTELARSVLANKFLVSYPTSPIEQKNIVAILDEAFSAITIAKENIEKNLSNSLKICESYLDNVLDNYSGKFEKKTLGYVCENVEYGTSRKSEKIGKVAVLRMGNIQGGHLDWNDLVFTSNEDEIKKYTLKKNDILFNRTNSAELVGKTAIYKGEYPAIFAGYLIRINIKKNLIDADFLNIYLNSKRIREYGFSVMSSSVNQANINGTKLKEYPLILPSLEDQKRIASKFISISLETKKLELIYKDKLEKLEELKKSFLEKAFNGELKRKTLQKFFNKEFREVSI
ncbi:restriction endonuclease subunit S [Fluviispira multicolorata]|uniref:Restriction endonuclease subunit S n=1 Tax=Fluviispira multicolorata TaxID=2654512 RepID=A0A833JEW8_9BACT|nr:restriction endonuclease subunit S [Fluviispira multicolorata]KAB8030715.1 restriction endonuclease subunit S [Fluviispira multicolorata]